MSVNAAKTPRLTVAMIVRDAEALIGPSLDSVRTIADEIVIADTGSSDRTAAIVSRRATKPLACNWVHDFSAARNFCLPQISGDFMLWLDAGEVLPPASASELRRWIDRTTEHRAGMVNVQLPGDSPSLSDEQASRLRLLPNHPQVRFSGRVRESAAGSLADLGIAVESLDVTLVRPVSDRQPEVKMAKARRDLRLADLELCETGSSPRVLIAMGEAFHTVGETAKAADCFRRAVLCSQRGCQEMLEAYYGLLTTLDGDDTQRDAQVAVAVEALEIFPTDAQLLCAMGTYLQKQGCVDLAARAYQTAVQFGQINPAVWHLTNLRELAVTCLSHTLQQQSRDDEARQVLEAALAGESSWLRVRRQLLDLHIKHSRRKEALEQVNALPQDTPCREPLRSAVRGACFAARQDWAGALPYLNAAYAGGCRDAICVRWLTLSLIAGGQYQQAEPILSDWLAVDPKSVEAHHYQKLLAKHRDELAPRRPVDLSLGERCRVDAPHAGVTTLKAGQILAVQPEPLGVSPGFDSRKT